jgi:hypothetical protein
MNDSLETLTADAHSYWNRDDPWTRSVSHFTGARRCPANRWKRIGDRNWQRFTTFVERVNARLEDFQSMVEWGPGGGANAVAFCRHFKRFYGVDVSRLSLVECRDQLGARMLADCFTEVPINCAEPHAALHLVDTPVDFFLSTACYQHFPSKSYGAHVTNLAGMMLRPDGIAMIQIRWNDGGQYHAPKTSKYCKGKNAIRFTSYNIGEFLGIASDAGLLDVGFLDVEPASCVYFYFVKRAQEGSEP